MDLKDEIAKYKLKIDSELKSFLDFKIKESRKISPYVSGLMKDVTEFTLRGGKRIRPVLTIVGYKAFNTHNEKEIIKAAISVELMQAFLLIHDDIMDQDELRRGMPTFHKVYENKFKLNKDHKHIGNSMAILAGDILAAMSLQPILTSGFPLSRRLEAASRFNNVILSTCYGQVLDIVSGYDSAFSSSDLRKVHMLKTAAYTLECPLQIGAILAGASDKDIGSISEFAIPLGQAFQIQDDIIGLFGDQKKIGKPVASDLKEGKKTLLILKALEKANKSEKQVILKSLGKKSLSRSEIDSVRDIIISTGSLDYSKSIAEKLVQKAVSSIRNSRLRDYSKEFLISLAGYIIKRQK